MRTPSLTPDVWTFVLLSCITFPFVSVVFGFVSLAVPFLWSFLSGYYVSFLLILYISILMVVYLWNIKSDKLFIHIILAHLFKRENLFIVRLSWIHRKPFKFWFSPLTPLCTIKANMQFTSKSVSDSPTLQSKWPPLLKIKLCSIIHYKELFQNCFQHQCALSLSLSLSLSKIILNKR